jgi:hypothetical protein
MAGFFARFFKPRSESGGGRFSRQPFPLFKPAVTQLTIGGTKGCLMKTKTSPIRNSMNGAPVRLVFLVIPLVLVCLIKSASAQAPVGYTRIQLKHGGQYLDAAYCGNTITLNPGSTTEGGACQLWRFVPADGGYFRIQLKHGGQYLDAAYCGKTITLNPGSTTEGGACQLWRLVPAGG